MALVLLLLLEAEAADFRTTAVALLLVAEREVLPPLLSSVSFPFRFLPFLLLLWFSSPPFSFLSVHSSSSPLSLFFGFFFVLLYSPLFFCSFLLLSVPFSPSSLGPIYRAQGVALYCSHGEQPAGRPLGATAKARPPSPVFWQVRGGWSAIVSGRWALGERVAGKKFELKQPFFPSSPLHVRGEEGR